MVVAGRQHVMRGAGQCMTGDRAHNAIGEISRRFGRRPLQGITQNSHFCQGDTCLLTFEQQ